MDEKIIEIIKKDIKRCESQTVNEGSYQLYQALMGNIMVYFKGFQMIYRSLEKFQQVEH